nr:AAA family ATPase [Nakamurella lactea]
MSGHAQHADQDIPDPAMVVLVGPAGSGKSHWAAAHYRQVEIVSSDQLRGVVGSGPYDQAASADAFDLLDRIVAARAGRALTTVVDTSGWRPIAAADTWNWHVVTDCPPSWCCWVPTRRPAGGATRSGTSRCRPARWPGSCGGCVPSRTRSPARVGIW